MDNVKRVVEFQFDVSEKVITPFGTEGVVTMIGVDNGGIQYHVNTASGGMWFLESQLQSV